MPTYTEDELQRISDQIMADAARKEQASALWLGKNIRDDWDDDLYVQDLYENYLKTVQQGHTNKLTGEQLDPKTSTFEKYLRECLATLTWRRGELVNELARNDIDMRVYGNAKDVADRAEAAIHKYLQKNETARLIGV
jgi:hypothetical protein